MGKRGVISVILPTRLRLDALKRSLSSLHAKATGDLEVLLAVDRDDPTDYSQVGPYSVFEARVTRVDRFGYERLHEYYNLLAAQASGRWVLLWNDDAIMATPGWDEVVRSYRPEVVLSPSTVHNPLCTFPIVPRRFLEALGHFSLNAHCDSWWEEIARELGILEWPALRVDHRRSDVCGENHDSVFLERRYQTEDFNSAEMVAARREDAKTVRGVLDDG